MIKFNIIWLIVLLVFVASFFAIILLTRKLTNPIGGERFSFTRNFPFEVMNNIDKGFSLYKIMLFIFVGASFAPIFAFIGQLGVYENFTILTVIITALFGVSSILFLFLFFFNPSNVKTQIILVTILMGTIVISGSLVGVLNTNVYLLNLSFAEDSYPQIIGGAMAIFFALVEIVSIFTFRLKDWASLETKNGGTLQRPKFFPLAAFEWLSFLCLFFEEFFFLISLIKY